MDVISKVIRITLLPVISDVVVTSVARCSVARLRLNFVLEEAYQMGAELLLRGDDVLSLG